MKKLVYLLLSTLLVACAVDGSKESVTPGTGTGGSTARFTISGNTLYMVGHTDLQPYDISTGTDPRPGTKIPLGIGVETIFPYRNNLFIGTQTGMFIYDISQPSSPQRVSLYSHIQSCDPVVAQGNYAYVTLRSGTTCRNNNLNSLDVVDISNLASPRLVKSYPMKNPHGLGIDGSVLFVGEGDYGLRVMDVSDPTNVREIQYFETTKTYDVIPTQKRLIVTGPDGIFQYSYADSNRLTLLSKLPIEP